MTRTMGTVPPPPRLPPLVGLIASLGNPGGPFLDPPIGVDSYDLAPFNPDRPTPDDFPAEGRAPEPGPLQRWEDGIRYQPYGCTGGDAQDPCSPDFTTIPSSPATVEAESFYIWAGDKCSSFGWAAHNYRDRATRLLLATESRQIATELWTGERAQAAGWGNHYLAHNAWADILTNGAVSPAVALPLLEGALAYCGNGQRGAIHVTPQMGSALSELGQTYRTAGGVISTYAGTIIIPDAGYDGSSPDGTPATSGHQWAYATLMPVVRRGPVEMIPDTFEEAMIRGTNDIEWRAARLANVSFDPCCHLAAEVDLPLPLVGGAS